MLIRENFSEEEASYLLAIKEKTENVFRVGKKKAGFSMKILRSRKKKLMIFNVLAICFDCQKSMELPFFLARSSRNRLGRLFKVSITDLFLLCPPHL